MPHLTAMSQANMKLIFVAVVVSNIYWEGTGYKEEPMKRESVHLLIVNKPNVIASYIV